MEKTYDVIIVGTGAAGLYAALEMDNSAEILMISKSNIEDSDSYLAQGGISTLLDENDYDAYYEDTLKAGRYENDPQAVNAMINMSNQIIESLIRYNVDFDKKEDGNLEYTREGGHSKFRILHHQDVTGREIVTKLLEEAKKRKNIHIYGNTTMVDLICKNNKCNGIVVEKDGSIENIFAKEIILATGGLGGIFKSSTNFPHISGDSFALAIRNDIEVKHLNYIQIHPTVLYSKKPGRRFLISESVRGEGAIIKDKFGNQFVDSLLPRDIVTNAIIKHMKENNLECVYLDCSLIPREKLHRHFPNIVQRCLEEGIDVDKDWIPIIPAQHYMMGGIKADINGVTSMRNLSAIGETACNGVHGANRLASNSLLESLVFAKKTVDRINKVINSEEITYGVVEVGKYRDLDKWNRENLDILWNEIKREDESFYDKWGNLKVKC